MSLYLEAYDAAVLHHWGEMLARHHASLRQPYARDWVRVSVDDDAEDIVAAPTAEDAPLRGRAPGSRSSASASNSAASAVLYPRRSLTR